VAQAVLEVEGFLNRLRNMMGPADASGSDLAEKCAPSGIARHRAAVGGGEAGCSLSEFNTMSSAAKRRVRQRAKKAVGRSCSPSSDLYSETSNSSWFFSIEKKIDDIGASLATISSALAAHPMGMPDARLMWCTWVPMNAETGKKAENDTVVKDSVMSTSDAEQSIALVQSSCKRSLRQQSSDPSTAAPAADDALSDAGTEACVDDDRGQCEEDDQSIVAPTHALAAYERDDACAFFAPLAPEHADMKISPPECATGAGDKQTRQDFNIASDDEFDADETEEGIGFWEECFPSASAMDKLHVRLSGTCPSSTKIDTGNVVHDAVDDTIRVARTLGLESAYQNLSAEPEVNGIDEASEAVLDVFSSAPASCVPCSSNICFLCSCGLRHVSPHACPHDGVKYECIQCKDYDAH
jgi:hypothetical protein